MVTMLKNKCSVWMRIKFPTFWYNCYYFTWSDTYFIQLETYLSITPRIRHTDNRKLLLIRILLLSHSLIFFSFLFYKNMVVNYVFLFSVGQGLLNVEVSRSHSFRRSTIGRTSLDEWSVPRRDFYLTTHNTHKRQTSIPPYLRRDSTSQSQQASGRKPTN